MGLLDARRSPSFGLLETIVLALYGVVAGTVAWFHEPWADEAQAWLIARDSSLRDLFLLRLHYEGTPGLWHLVLWGFSRAHLSYGGMHVATVLFGVAGVAVLLRYAPFPVWLRCGLPFTFPLLFQTAVIARSYSLLPLLVFPICYLLSGRRRHPIVLAILLGLLANTSLIAFVLAVSFVPVFLRGLPTSPASVPARRSLMLASMALLLLLATALYTAIPAPDITYGLGEGLAAHPPIAHLFSRLTGIPAPQSVSVAPFPGPLKPVKANAMWPPLRDLRRGSIASSLAHRTLNALDLAFFAISGSNLVAILFLASLVLWLRRYGALVAALPFVAVVLAGAVLGLVEHHISVVAVALIASLWLGWSRIAALPRVPLPRADLIFQILLAVVVAEQIAWTGHAAWFDIHQPFDGSRQAARFLGPPVAGRRVAITGGEALAIQPYRTQNIFANSATTYWPWRRGINPDSDLAATLASRPDILVDGESYSGTAVLPNQIVRQLPDWEPYDQRDKAAYFMAQGYRETHRFCGQQPAHFSFSRRICLVMYEPGVTLPGSLP